MDGHGAGNPGAAAESDILPPDEAFEWAEQAARDRRWGLAARRWATLRAVYPDQAPVWLRGGVALLRLARFDEARALFSEARARFPNHPGGWVYGSEALLACASHAEAADLLREARQYFSDHPPVWLRSADLAWAEGDPDTALAYNRHAREQFADKPGGYVQYAEFAMHTDDWDAARERWARVRELFPELPAGYRRAAEVEERAGRRREARRLRFAEGRGPGWLKESDSVAMPVAPPPRRDWRRFLDLVWTKARLNLKSEASRDQLHYLWWVIEPLMFMAVYYMVFAVLLRSGGENYVAYLLSGVMPFQWFAKTIQHASGSIMQGRGLMQSVRVSPLFFPLVSLVQNTGKQIPVFLLLGLLVTFSGQPPTVHWLALAPIILLQFYFMAVLGCLLAMLIPFFRDLTNLVPIGIRFALFASGVFYTLDTIPERWLGVFLSNPMANLLYQYRLVLVEQSWPDWHLFGGLLIACMLGSLIVWGMYRRLEAVFPRVVIE